MTSTVFVPGTPIVKEWLNNVNTSVYSGTTAPVANGFSSYLFGRSTAEILAGKSPTIFGYAESDIRRYGALEATADNSTAINTALAVSAAGGQPAFIPNGGWAYTSTLNAITTSSMCGEGKGSVLQPNGCDGITFTNQGSVAGPRFFRDFSISGTATGSKAGIKAAMLAASGNRVTGVVFDNLYIANFGTGVDSIGLWNCTWRDCFLYNNYQGFLFSERSIKTTLVDCSVVKGAITGVGTQVACQFVQVGAVRPEDAMLRGCYFYGYDIAVDVSNCLYCVIEHCDFDNCQLRGVKIGTINGGMTVRDCWINVNASAATIGIEVIAAGSEVPEKVQIVGNNFTNLAPFAGSIGVSVGTNQAGVVVQANYFRDFEIAVRTGTVNHFVCKWNNISATDTAIVLGSSGIDYDIGPNYIITGVPISYTAGTPVGMKYYATGSYTVTLTGMTTTITGTVTWTANGSTVFLSIPSAISGTSNATAMTGTGMPADIRPATAGTTHLMRVTDNGTTVLGTASIATTGVITFGNGVSGAVFTGGAVVKGLPATEITYLLG